FMGARRAMIAGRNEPPARMNRHRRRHWNILGVVAAAVCLLNASFVLRYPTALYLDEASACCNDTLDLSVTALRRQLARTKKLLQLIADDPDIKELVTAQENRAKVDEINGFLKQINGLLESSDIYVMLPDGNTLAASNFDQTPTFI